MLLLSRYQKGINMSDPKDTAAHVRSLTTPTPTPTPTVVKSPPPTVAAPTVTPPPPEVKPQATQIAAINATVDSKGGRNSINMRAPGNAIFNSPDGQLVLTDLRLAVFDQFLVGQVYSIVISTTP
jgi:hypothetical protein